MHAGVGGGCEFGADAVVEFHAIIARTSHFVSVAERGGLIEVAGRAHGNVGVEECIGKVGATRSAEVVVRESVDLRVAVMVAAASVPVAGASVGAELHSAMWHSGSGIGVSVAASADKWVNEVGHRLCRCGITGKQCHCQRGYE